MMISTRSEELIERQVAGSYRLQIRTLIYQVKEIDKTTNYLSIGKLFVLLQI